LHFAKYNGVRDVDKQTGLKVICGNTSDWFLWMWTICVFYCDDIEHMTYRVIKKSLCTWRLQYKKHAKNTVF